MSQAWSSSRPFGYWSRSYMRTLRITAFRFYLQALLSTSMNPRDSEHIETTVLFVLARDVSMVHRNSLVRRRRGRLKLWIDEKKGQRAQNNTHSWGWGLGCATISLSSLSTFLSLRQVQTGERLVRLVQTTKPRKLDMCAHRPDVTELCIPAGKWVDCICPQRMFKRITGLTRIKKTNNSRYIKKYYSDVLVDVTVFAFSTPANRFELSK